MKCKENLNISLVFTLILIVSGCQNFSAPTNQASNPDNTEQYLSFISKAKSAIAKNHLTVPFKNSALSYLQKANNLKPDSIEVTRGLDDIVERYITLTKQQLEMGSITTASLFLERAETVQAEHPSIGPARAQISLLESADQRIFELDTEDLAERSLQLVAFLKDIGSMGASPECRTTITTPNDADGRWIYRSLSSSNEYSRIRATIQKGLKPLVKISCSKKQLLKSFPEGSYSVSPPLEFASTSHQKGQQDQK